MHIYWDTPSIIFNSNSSCRCALVAVVVGHRDGPSPLEGVAGRSRVAGRLVGVADVHAVAPRGRVRSWSRRECRLRQWGPSEWQRTSSSALVALVGFDNDVIYNLLRKTEFLRMRDHFIHFLGIASNAREIDGAVDDINAEIEG